VALPDSRHCLADGPGHTRSRAFRLGTRPPTAAAEAYGASELTDKEVSLGLGLSGPTRISYGACFFDVSLDFSKTPSVRLLGLRIEQFAGIASSPEWQAGVADSADIPRADSFDSR
jgi:hypothetical protein